MADVAKKYQDNLPRIKDNVANAYNYFEHNYKIWHEWHSFVNITTIGQRERQALERLNKPLLEFNIIEAYISRLQGEFSKQLPAIAVNGATGKKVDPNILNIVESYIRHIEYEARAKGIANELYSDMLYGSFGVAKVTTEYANNKSFDQEISVCRVYDPTLTGFDPLARRKDKSDGRYCFELFPKTKTEFEAEHPDVDTSSLSFVRASGGFSWSYNNNKEDILLICDYYEKKKKRKKIIQLSNGINMNADDYEKFAEEWMQSGQGLSVPTIIKERFVMDTVICRYRFIENTVIEYVETDYKYLPLVFFNGKSVTCKKSDDGALKQYTSPYGYKAKGVQQLKNMAGQTLANEIENISQIPIAMPNGGIPEGYESAYTSPQKPAVLIYNQFLDNNPQIPLNPPTPFPRAQIPPEITNSFTIADQMSQTILGSYDASLGINDNQLSGVAIVEGATQSNSTAMPYIVGYLQGYNQIATIILDLIPKYYTMPKQLPQAQPDGSRSSVWVNVDGGISLDYDSEDLNVEISAGVSFSVQKSKALQQIIALMQASPAFAQFMNSQGLPVLLDNLEIRGVDQLKDMVGSYVQQQQQMAQQQQQQAMQNNPQYMSAMNDKMRIQANMQQDQVENQLKQAELAINATKADTDRMKAMAEAQDNAQMRQMEMMKNDTERMGQAVDVALKTADMRHNHAKETVETVHKVTKGQ